VILTAREELKLAGARVHLKNTTEVFIDHPISLAAAAQAYLGGRSGSARLKNRDSRRHPR
jgi:hypothetical protein